MPCLQAPACVRRRWLLATDLGETVGRQNVDEADDEHSILLCNTEQRRVIDDLRVCEPLGVVGDGLDDDTMRMRSKQERRRSQSEIGVVERRRRLAVRIDGRFAAGNALEVIGLADSMSSEELSWLRL